ncbi:MAG TPA: NfeD family protein [Elusimicrobiota bacterium]|nr:NfeD family protein [Elusimicrobiota bacterium]
MSSTKFWLIMAVVAVIIEILPPPTHFFFLCVALGALGAAIAAFFFTMPWVPWAVFGIATVALTPMMIPLARFLFTPKPHPSNADALIGEKALVLETVTPKSAGTVKIGGEVWRAMTEQESFEKDQWVQVAKVEGTHVVVRRNA